MNRRPLKLATVAQTLGAGEQLIHSDGTLSQDILLDWLHLSPAGYKIWARLARQPL